MLVKIQLKNILDRWEQMFNDEEIDRCHHRLEIDFKWELDAENNLVKVQIPMENREKVSDAVDKRNELIKLITESAESLRVDFKLMVRYYCKLSMESNVIHTDEDAWNLMRKHGFIDDQGNVRKDI